MHIDLAMRLAEVLKQIWKQADQWNDDAKRAIAALTCPIEGTLDCLDRLYVCTLTTRLLALSSLSRNAKHCLRGNPIAAACPNRNCRNAVVVLQSY